MPACFFSTWPNNLFFAAVSHPPPRLCMYLNNSTYCNGWFHGTHLSTAKACILLIFCLPTPNPTTTKVLISVDYGGWDARRVEIFNFFLNISILFDLIQLSGQYKLAQVSFLSKLRSTDGRLEQSSRSLAYFNFHLGFHPYLFTTVSVNSDTSP